MLTRHQMEIYGMEVIKKNFVSKIQRQQSLFLSLIHRIFDTVNLSLLGFILIFSFLSLNSQREWSKL